MRFYTGQHRHYCGSDLHAATMYVCIVDAAGEILVHRNARSNPEALLEIIAHKIGRAVYYILARGTVFSHEKFANA